MSKYRHIEINKGELHNKKRSKKIKEELPSNYFQTINLMEKLGIKIINNENLLKSINLRKFNNEDMKKDIRNVNEEEKVNKSIKSSSQQKRKKNVNKKKYFFSQNPKRTIKKDFIKKEESVNNKIVKIKQYKNHNEKNPNDTYYSNKKMNKISNKKENIINTSTKTRISNDNNYYDDNIKALILKKISSKGKKENRTVNSKNKKVATFRNIDKDNIINDNSMNKKIINSMHLKNPKSDKKRNVKNLSVNSIKDNFSKNNEDINNKNRIKRNKIINKSNSVKKDLSNNTFNLKIKISTKYINTKNNNSNELSEKSENNITPNKKKTNNRYDKRYSLQTDCLKSIKTINTKTQKNSKKSNIIYFNKGKSESAEKKRFIRSNQRCATEMMSRKYLNILMDRSSSKTIRNSKYNINNFSNKRRSQQNHIASEKFEKILNLITLRNNGYNTQYLKNYEIGYVHNGQIELIIKNKKYIKKLKIGSCFKPGCSGPGIIKINQDSFFIKEKFLDNENNYFLGVCDGHGEKGQIISQYVSEKLPEYINNINSESIINEFKKINKEIYDNNNIESDISGTTVSSLILISNKILSINLGDSRSCIFKKENDRYSYKYLTRDHKPTEKDERIRIINNNGRIKQCYDEQLKKFIGPERIWLKNEDTPGLAMTRSIGDKIAHNVGVIEEPEFKYYEYDGKEKFIIIATDGIWEYLNGDDCIKIVKKFYEEELPIEEACYALVKESFDKWKRKEVVIDDITATIIFFYD